jgi:hypothetical protein
MQNGKSAKWQRVLEELMAGTDAEKMRNKADELEAAIFHRCQTLACGDAEDSERAAIKAATTTLLKVRVEKLAYPLDPELLQGIAGESVWQGVPSTISTLCDFSLCGWPDLSILGRIAQSAHYTGSIT